MYYNISDKKQTKVTQEEKDLFLRDLCARLSYGVQVCYKIHLEDEPIDVTLSGLLLDYFNNKTVVEIKPYLRPMSSMTEEEVKEFAALESIDVLGGDIKITCVELSIDAIDWLNKKMFDYRGLIKRGLALEAPEGMYKI